MAAASADVNTVRGPEVLFPYSVYQAVKIYAGTLVCARADGYAIPGADSTGLIFLGVAEKQADNSSGSSGDMNVEVRRAGTFWFECASTVTIANIGDEVYVSDDQNVALVADVTYAIFCGRIEAVSGTKVLVNIYPAIQTTAVTTHIADTTGAHAASAISTTDACNYFPAATDTVEEQIQSIASLAAVVTIPRQTGWTKDATDQALPVPAFEFPFAVKLVRAYGLLGTAPGASKTLTVDVNGTQALEFVETAATDEDEALNIAIAANTDITVTANETASGAGANLDMILIFAHDDGE